MSAFHYLKKFRTVLIMELLIITAAGTFAYNIWNTICDGGFSRCFDQTGHIPILKYLGLAFIRPFTFFPQIFFEVLGAKAWTAPWVPLVIAFSSVFSWLSVFFIAKIVGKKIVTPWLSSNLPQTLKFLRSQDWKITLFTRTLPLIPQDLLSFIYGILDFRWKATFWSTLATAIPEAYLVYYITYITRNDGSLALDLFTAMLILNILFCLPGIIWEYMSRRHGSGLWLRLKAMWQEILYEIKTNNEIVKRSNFKGDKVPILLLYGFFSSRRSLSVIERHLKAKGYEVISFNLGGLFGVFFTRGIIETAHFVDYKLKRQFERYDFNKVKVVAHSKGGLVALWWLLRLGGYRHCDQVITMGTPFRGSILTWLALVTPLGFIWRDMWQMRPGSRMLKILGESVVPEGIEIYCMYSGKDRVSSGIDGVYRSPYIKGSVAAVPMHHISHFEYLHKREVADEIAKILGQPEQIERVKSEQPANDIGSSPGERA